MVTVLVVDDEAKIRELVGAYLQRDGHSVLLAHTGLEAMDMAERLAPDLLVLDLGLPDIPVRSCSACSAGPATSP